MGDSANILIGLLAMCLGAVLLLWVIPAQTVPAIFASVPSGFYSAFTSWMLIISGLGLTVAGVTAERRTIDRSRTARQAIVFGVAFVLLSVATLSMPVLGFISVGAGVCLVTLLLMRERRWIMIAAVSLAVPLIIWGGFEVFLGRPLP